MLSTYEKQRIFNYHGDGLNPSQIASALKVKGIHVYTTGQTVARFVKRYLQTGSIAHKQGARRPSKITSQVLELVEQKVREDDETATQLHALLTTHHVSISLSTILRSRAILGWTFRGSKYCQLIRHENESKCFLWACDNFGELLEDGFNDVHVIWSDETTVQLETHHRHSYRKKRQQATLKPCPKHPIKLYAGAGISKRGASDFYRDNGCRALHIDFGNEFGLIHSPDLSRLT